MKVLHVNTLLRGGAGIAVQRLNEALKKSAVDSGLLTLEKLDKSRDQHFSYENELSGIEKSLYPLKSLIAKIRYKQKTLAKKSGYEPYHFVKTPFDITKLDCYKSADIIHLHWISGFVDLPSFFKKNEKPVCWTLHDLWPYSGGFHYEIGFPFEDYQKEISYQESLKTELYKNSNIHVIALNHWMGILAKSSKTMHKLNFHVLPNCCNTHIFNLRESPSSFKQIEIPKDKKVILFVADHISNKRKGFDILSTALEKLNKEKYFLICVGDATTKTPVSENIYYTGKIKDENEMSDIYNIADAFVLPSLEDNQPNTVMESLCCGTPVIGFRVGGVQEMIGSDMNGSIIDEISPNGLAQGIEHFFNRPTVPDRALIARNASSKFGYDVQSKNYIKLYEELLS